MLSAGRWCVSVFYCYLLTADCGHMTADCGQLTDVWLAVEVLLALDSCQRKPLAAMNYQGLNHNKELATHQQPDRRCRLSALGWELA